MKVLQIINSLNMGGAEKLLSDMLPNMKKKGVDIDVIVLCDIDNKLKENLLESNITVRGLVRNMRSIYNPLIMLKLAPLLKDYDLIHVHLFPSQYWVALIKFLINSKIALITTEHSTSNRRRKIKLFKPLEKFIYKLYDRIITISDTAESVFNNYIYLPNKVKTIYNGIDLEKYYSACASSRRKFGISDTDFLLIMVASFREAKDQDTIIQALTYLPDNVKLILVGDGERKFICESLVSDLDLINRVSFLGVRYDVPNLLKMSDVVIMSSHYEGLSLSSIEGMSVSKPFVASNVPGLSEITEEAGELFPESDAVNLSSIIKKLMNDKQYYESISVRCLERSKKYDINRMVDQLIELYKDIIIKKQKNK